MTIDTAALIGLASVAGAVAGFYYTTLRSDVKALIAEPVPYDDDRLASLRGRLVAKIKVTVLVLVLHLPLTVLFFAGAVTAMMTLDIDAPVDAAKVAVVVIAGLAGMHLWLISGDLRSLVRKVKRLPKPSPDSIQNASARIHGNKADSPDPPVHGSA